MKFHQNPHAIYDQCKAKTKEKERVRDREKNQLTGRKTVWFESISCCEHIIFYSYIRSYKSDKKNERELIIYWLEFNLIFMHRYIVHRTSSNGTNRWWYTTTTHVNLEIDNLCETGNRNALDYVFIYLLLFDVYKSEALLLPKKNEHTTENLILDSHSRLKNFSLSLSISYTNISSLKKQKSCNWLRFYASCRSSIFCDRIYKGFKMYIIVSCRLRTTRQSFCCKTIDTVINLFMCQSINFSWKKNPTYIFYACPLSALD